MKSWQQYFTLLCKKRCRVRENKQTDKLKTNKQKKQQKQNNKQNNNKKQNNQVKL